MATNENPTSQLPPSRDLLSRKEWNELLYFQHLLSDDDILEADEEEDSEGALLRQA